MEEVSQAIVAALLADGPKGRRFDDDVLRDAVPVLLLSIAGEIDPDTLPAALLRMLDGFLDRAEANRSNDPSEIVGSIERYLSAHPLPADLWETVQRVLEHHGEGLGDDALERLRTFSQFSDRPRRAPGVDDPIPEGTARGGLLLRAKFRNEGKDS